jgi:hypothetical protein
MLRTVRVEVSAAQLLAMKATPVVVVPVLGGFAVYPISAVINYYPVSVDYALGDATSLYIGSAVNPISVTNVLPPIPAAILNGSGGPGNVIGMYPGSNALVVAQSWIANQPLVLTHNGSAELTLGDGTVVVTLSLFMAAV